MRKVYVKVKAEFDTAGFLSPLSLTWEDGREFPIDRVLDAQRAASRKAGGIGTRYTVRIQEMCIRDRGRAVPTSAKV